MVMIKDFAFMYLTLAGPCIIIQFKQINQPDATALQVCYMTFMFRSTCFGRIHAHHQELTTALTASGVTLELRGSSIVGPTTLLQPSSNGKTRGS
jgi:hypothetical protein